MFTHEEIMVLDELGINTVDEAIDILKENMAETEDDFAKEFLMGLIDKISPLTDEEFCGLSIISDYPIDSV